jgi:hypothetical protein
VSGVLGAVVLLSGFGAVSWGFVVESVVFAGDGMLSGVDVGAPPGCGSVVGVVSGTVAPGVFGIVVLLPPEGVCSLIGWLLCDCDEVSGVELLDGDCATTNPADRIASVAIYESFFMCLSLVLDLVR